jgi:dolichol-phosphate mannosyltransferase
VNPDEAPRLKVLVIVPTYNERENIETLVRAVLGQRTSHSVSALVVDDSSPDGTAGVVCRMMEEFSTRGRLFLLSRARKNGLGGAYVAGFSWGLERGFDLLVEMDGDLSHDPAYLPHLVEASRRFDFVIGSRYVRGGGVKGWGTLRKLISRGGTLFSRIMLGVRMRDLTGGFNAWNRAVFRKVNLAEILSNGYCFQIELKYRAASNGFSWIEIPILFRDRVHGRSKMSGRIALEAVRTVLVLPRRLKRG